VAHTYNGRDVILNVVTFGDLVESQEAAERTGKSVSAMWLLLTRSATYADDGTQVFASVDDIMKAPAPEANNIMEMSAEVSRKNLPATVPTGDNVPSP